MRMDVITLFPEMFQALLERGVTARAIRTGVMSCHFWNLRDFSDDPHGRVDDRPYGGGPGMVIRPEPLSRAVQAVRDDRRELPEAQAPVIYLSPQGRVLEQAAVRDFAAGSGCILVAGRYEGVDERWIELEVDDQWSIGRYVLSGGELPAMVLLDAVARLLPGTLGNSASAQTDSFGGDGLPEGPQYTRPRNFQGLQVPEVLLGGDHERIAEWRLDQARRMAEKTG